MFGFRTDAVGLPAFSTTVKNAQVFRKVPKVDPVAAGIDWKFMYTRVSGWHETCRHPSMSDILHLAALLCQSNDAFAPSLQSNLTV